MTRTKTPAPLYAVVGAGDLVVERLRTTAAAVDLEYLKADLQDLKDRKVDWRELPEHAQASAQQVLGQALGIAAGTYSDLVERGEQLVTRVRKQQSTQRTAAQARTTSAQAKGTATTAQKQAKSTGGTAKRTSKKATRATTTRAKATTTSAKKTAASATQAAGDAAGKVGN
jgi:hypothetical protein